MKAILLACVLLMTNSAFAQRIRVEVQGWDGALAQARQNCDLKVSVRKSLGSPKVVSSGGTGNIRIELLGAAQGYSKGTQECALAKMTLTSYPESESVCILTDAIGFPLGIGTVSDPRADSSFSAAYGDCLQKFGSYNICEQGDMACFRR